METLTAREIRAVLRDIHVLLPVSDASKAQEMVRLAAGLLGNDEDSPVGIIGITQVPAEASLSEGALLAQQLRNDLDKLSAGSSRIKRLPGSLVSHKPWEDLVGLVDQRADDKDLLLLPWEPGMKLFQTDVAEVMKDPPCSIVVARPSVPLSEIKRILLPVRGGPFANLSLQLAVRLARAASAEITVLRVLSRDDDTMSALLRERFTGLSDLFPEITTELQVMGEAGTAILRELKNHQAVILGASAIPDAPIGSVAALILQSKAVTTLVVRTKEPFRLPAAPARQADLPVLVRVEKWFAENTFHSREFADIDLLVDLKRKQGLRVSLGLPSHNDEATIGNVIQTMKSRLMDGAPLLDEIVLIDSNSTDFTRRVAAGLGVTPYIHQETLPGLGSLRGKGEALWKSLYLLKGDLLVWIDTSIINPHPRLVYGILGPLLMDSQVQYVKGFYQRPATDYGEMPPSPGGRVTELLARPMINLFFPELSGVVQPLGGFYGGRRTALEQIPFYSGLGVEVGLLLDLLDRLGLKAIAQVDLEEVRHSNQELRELSKVSFAILQVFAQHLRQRGMIDAETPIERTMKLLCVEDQRFHLEEVDVHEQKRPPMIEVKEYRGRHLRRLAKT